MKYIVMLGDGMADVPDPRLNNQTPLDVAVKPHMDRLAAHGRAGMVHTIPPGMSPGSDTANLSVMGYDPGCITVAALRWRRSAWALPWPRMTSPCAAIWSPCRMPPPWRMR